MTFRKSALATVATAALVLAGCEGTHNPSDPNDEAHVGVLRAAITLPDDSVVTSVHYDVMGPGAYGDMGDVPVGNSTILTFRLGGIPIGMGTITLSADTSLGNSCTGSAPFEILDNNVSMVTVVLDCGATDNVGDLIVNGEFRSCPLINSISAIPAETLLGTDVSLTTVISHGTASVHWSGAGGDFSAADDYDTDFTCTGAGPHTLTVAISDPALPDCHDSRTLDVVCTLGAGCGNGNMDVGEGCDDGNTVDGDGCDSNCTTTACGNGIPTMGEACDDGNLTSGDGCDSNCTATACGNGVRTGSEACDDGNAVDGDTCNTNCTIPGCGDGITTGTEECDDGNTSNTDACTNACDLAACGDGFIQPPETCDDTNTTAGDGCSDTCQTEVVDTHCTECRAANCTAYLDEVNLVAGCFDFGASGDAARSVAGATFTMQQVQYCIDAVNCAFANNCAYNPATGYNPCYCGAIDQTTCSNSGPDLATSPCLTETRNAGGTTVHNDLILRFSNFSYPLGWATALLTCDTSSCSGAMGQIGDCTP